MLVIWGTKRVNTRLGYVADFCPICRDLQVFKLKRVGMAGHVYYISFGEGKLVGHVRTCAVCSVDLNAEAAHYREISPERRPAAELAPLTHPEWKRRHEARLALERELKSAFGKVSAEDRAWLLREPFHLLSPAVEERFSASRFDGRTLLAVVAAFLLIGIASALGESVPAADVFIVSLGWLGALGLVGWQLWTISRRWFQSKIFPILVPALRPLRPTRAELEQILKELKSQGHKIGKKLPLEDLVAALSGGPMPMTNPDAATMIPAMAGAFAGAAAPMVPPAVPAPAPAPAPALGTPAAGPAKRPELKLKFGGVRHRVSKDDGEITLGRDPGSVIHVGAPHVSRHHATIIWMDDGYPLLVNLSQSGTSIQQDGGQPMTIDGSTRLEGTGRIGLFADFAYAEANNSVVVFEAKWPPRS